MAHLTSPTKYDIKDSNIALLGSDLEKRVREHAGDKEHAWEKAGTQPGLEIWRIEKFTVVSWPKDRSGSFYDGDSYIVLHTYKKTPESKSFLYDLHFWLGENTTQDEAGTAAFKTVELDDHLHGSPVQYREVQGSESARFLTYFPRFVCLRGGVSTGFHHVSAPPPLKLRKLYKITLSKRAHGQGLMVREVSPDKSSLVAGDVYVLDTGDKVWQYNSKTSSGQEKFKAAEFVRSLVNEREGHCKLTVYDEGGSGSRSFLSEFGLDSLPPSTATAAPHKPPTLYRLSDSTGSITFETVEAVSISSLHSDDAFLLDDSTSATFPAVYVWLGKDASLNEKRLAVQYATTYVYQQQQKEAHGQVTVTIVKLVEGKESESFTQALKG